MNITPLPSDFDPLAVHVPTPVVPQVQAVAQPVAPQTTSEEVSKAETDAAYYGIQADVPSKLAFAPYSKLSIRPYGLAELFKIGAATKGGRVHYIVEAVGATLDRPVMSGALMDFWFCAYWLRTMSYKSSPLTITWSCEAHKHYRDVELEKVPADTLMNTTLITKSDIKVEPIDIAALEPIAKELVEFGVQLAAPTVSDFLERLDMDVDDEMEFLIDSFAVYLNVVHGKKLIDRVGFIRGLISSVNGMRIIELLQQAQTLLDAGRVLESLQGTCKHCGEVQKVEVEVDLLSFFPFRV